MADFILDADPLIPTGIPATPEQVAELVVADDITRNCCRNHPAITM